MAEVYENKNVNVGSLVKRRQINWYGSLESISTSSSKYFDQKVKLQLSLCFKGTSSQPIISKSLPIFVLKDNYNTYYYKKFLNVTSPSKCHFFFFKRRLLNTPPPASPHTHTHPTKEGDKSKDRSESISTWQISKITIYSC